MTPTPKLKHYFMGIRSSRPRYLLDTNIWIWLNGMPEKIGADVLRVIERPQCNLFLSAVSGWEVAVKYAAGKLTLPRAPEQFFAERIQALGIEIVPIELRHTFAAANLPMHHRDPFDRLLVAQAQLENLTLISADQMLKKYDCELLLIE